MEFERGRGCNYAHRGKWRIFDQVPNFVMRNPMDCRAGYCAMVPGHGQGDTSRAVALGPVKASAEGPRHRGRTAQSLCRPSRLGRCASQRPPGERQKGEAKAGDYNAPQRSRAVKRAMLALGLLTLAMTAGYFAAALPVASGTPPKMIRSRRIRSLALWASVRCRS